jgi:hypothetical protein
MFEDRRLRVMSDSMTNGFRLENGEQIVGLGCGAHRLRLMMRIAMSGYTYHIDEMH